MARRRKSRLPQKTKVRTRVVYRQAPPQAPPVQRPNYYTGGDLANDLF